MHQTEVFVQHRKHHGEETSYRCEEILQVKLQIQNWYPINRKYQTIQQKGNKNKPANNLILKCSKDINRNFLKDVQMANKDKKMLVIDNQGPGGGGTGL